MKFKIMVAAAINKEMQSHWQFKDFGNVRDQLSNLNSVGMVNKWKERKDAVFKKIKG
jgi:hypothetical protein